MFPDRSGHIDRGVDSTALLSIYGLVDEGVIYLLNPNPIQSSIRAEKNSFRMNYCLQSQSWGMDTLKNDKTGIEFTLHAVGNQFLLAIHETNIHRSLN